MTNVSLLHLCLEKKTYMIAFTQSDKCCDDMIARRVAVVKRLVAEPMC